MLETGGESGDMETSPFRDGLGEFNQIGEGTYITLQFLQPDLDLLNVMADTTNHGLERSRYRNLMSDSGSR